MAVGKFNLLLCALTCLCSVTCELDLPAGSTCITDGHNGTCIELYKCNSAKTIALYEEAGFGSKYNFPKQPDVCSFNGDEPVVCCTDCHISDNDDLRHTGIGPLGVMGSKRGSVARAKCFDYFKILPYRCRGVGNVDITRPWNETRQCHLFSYYIALAVGGRDAKKWEFPHMALLGYGDDVEAAQWLCGGSVISERFILTAAHCSATRTLDSIKYAALGLLKRSDPKENWKIYNIKRIIVHPEYKAPVKYHDIALLETETEINFGRDLLPACLETEYSAKKHYVEAAGWGSLGHNQGLADILQVVKLTEFDETTCAAMYQPHRHLKRGYDHKTQMCFGSATDLIDTCEGDSGGPLQLNKFDCQYSVIGVTSYGKECGIIPGSSGIYTRVSHYIPWIESIVWPGETNE